MLTELTIPVELADSILQYLVQRPYSEVERLVKEIMRLANEQRKQLEVKDGESREA